MITINALRGGRCTYGFEPPSFKQMIKSGASIGELMEARIERGLQKTANSHKWDHQEAIIKIKDHPIKRLILRMQGKSDANFPVQIKGKIVSDLFGSDCLSIEKFQKEVTYRDLKNAALGKNKKTGGNNLIEEICTKMNHMSEIGLA